MEERSLTIQIRSVSDEPPTGVVLGEDKVPVPFAGWLDLMQVIERLASGSGSVVPAVAADPLITPSLAEAPG